MPINLIASMPLRRTVDRGFQWFARRRTRFTNQTVAAEAQSEILLRLVHRARWTRFGRDHDFAGIHSIEEYQERVPLREYEALWSKYWRHSLLDGESGTWPGRTPYVALSSGTTSGSTKYIPVSRAMLRSNCRAALTALAWYRNCRPEAQLFTGRMFFLGGSTDLRPAGSRAARRAPRIGDLSGIVANEVSRLLQPFAFPPRDLALLDDWDEKIQRLAEESARQPITLVSGVPSWLLVLFDRLRQITGRERIADIWPQLRLVVHGGTTFDSYRKLFREIVGDERVDFLETYPASEGFVAAEDPHYGLLRLIADHDVYFEFVPAAELKSDRPTRHTLADIVPGVHYAVVLTTCAGLWSYVLGDIICFERRDPPLLRFVGRTQQTLSAFGEHLIGEEVEAAVTYAAARTGASVSDFCVGPVFPAARHTAGRHRYFVEFVAPPENVDTFAAAIDTALCRKNDDYRAHRQGNLNMDEPEVVQVPQGGFARWMRACGRLGGQHKVPRIDTNGMLTAELSRLFTREAAHELSGAR